MVIGPLDDHRMCSICLYLFGALSKAVRLLLHNQPMYPNMCSIGIFDDVQLFSWNLKGGLVDPPVWGARWRMCSGMGPFDSQPWVPICSWHSISCRLLLLLFCCLPFEFVFCFLIHKLSQCYRLQNVENPAPCPVCSVPLNQLARRLPFAHCAQSRLICAISGLPLNEYNPPMMLPNGHVYGYNVSKTTQ